MDGIQTLWCYESLLNFVMKPVLEIEYNTTSLIEKDHLGDRSHETDCFFATDVLTTCAEAIFRVKENSAYQGSNHPDDLFRSRYVTPRFKPFS